MIRYKLRGFYKNYKELSRKITKNEYDRVLNALYELNENEVYDITKTLQKKYSLS